MKMPDKDTLEPPEQVEEEIEDAEYDPEMELDEADED